MAKLNVGVDVGSTSIKAVQISGSRGKIKIIRAAEVPLTRGIVVSGDVKQVEELSNALNVLWKKGKFTTRNVTLGVAGEFTVTRDMDMPWEPEAIFRKALPLRVGDAFPFNPVDMLLDHHPLELKGVSGLIQQRSLVVAADSGTLEKIIEGFTISKLRVKNVDFNPFALIRAAVITGEAGEKATKKKKSKKGAEAEATLPANDCEVIVDIGGFITMVSIHSHGKPLFVRIVPGGSDAATKALADKLSLRIEMAEVLKQYLGIQGIEPSQLPSDIAEQVSAEKIANGQTIINFVAGHLVQEVRKTVEYYLSVAPEVLNISRIYLSGGGVMLPGLASRLGSELRSPIAKLNPIEVFSTGKSVSSSAIDPNMSVAFGLALEAYANG